LITLKDKRRIQKRTTTSKNTPISQVSLHKNASKRQKSLKVKGNNAPRSVKTQKPPRIGANFHFFVFS